MSFIFFRVSVMGSDADNERSEKKNDISFFMFDRVKSLSLNNELNVVDSIYRFVLREFCFLRVISNVNSFQRLRSPFFFH